MAYEDSRFENTCKGLTLDDLFQFVEVQLRVSHDAEPRIDGYVGLADGTEIAFSKIGF